MVKSVIISGGGTGGHIFPAVSIANEIRRQSPQAEILFIGAEGRMEMEKVPAAGYPIIGLPIRGMNRSNPLKNIQVFLLLIKSLVKAYQVIRNKRPEVVIGVGGYASGPTLWVAQRMGIPTLIQEQNSYAGVTNKLLAKKAKAICVAYPGMDRFFPADRLTITGNPVRQDLFNHQATRDEAIRFFGLDPKKKTVLIVGGSLGARTLNESLLANRSMIESHPEVQILWQCGGYYKERMEAEMSNNPIEGVSLHPFIYRMDLAYQVADVIISRAGAGTISELAIVGKPTILVPSPNVAEDHQTQNALALVRKDAALMIKDSEASEKLYQQLYLLMEDSPRSMAMGQNITLFRKEKAAEEIYQIISQITKA